MLSQEQDDGLEHVVAYASRALSTAERRYSATHKELLAVVVFMPFLALIDGERFTDHHSLLWLKSFREPKGQVTR